jgi:hypothetical protein
VITKLASPDFSLENISDLSFENRFEAVLNPKIGAQTPSATIVI